MDRTPITSSNLVSVGYDEKTQVLEVEFKPSSLYQYTGVPKRVYDEMTRAESPGKFFHAHVRGQYATKKV